MPLWKITYSRQLHDYEFVRIKSIKKHFRDFVETDLKAFRRRYKQFWLSEFHRKGDELSITVYFENDVPVILPTFPPWKTARAQRHRDMSEWLTNPKKTINKQ